MTSSARLKRLSCRSLMYSDFTLLFQQAGPFSERFPVSTMINLRQTHTLSSHSVGTREHVKSDHSSHSCFHSFNTGDSCITSGRHLL